MRLLLTRPRHEGERSAAELRARGHEPIVAPLLRIEMNRAEFGQGPFSAVAMTSANAARAVALHPGKDAILGLPAFAVGRRSAEAAAASGFHSVVSADGDVHDLVRLITARLAGARHPLLYLAGEHRAADLAGALAEQNIALHMVAIYRAVPEHGLPHEGARALSSREIDGILHYSRRTARAFLVAATESGLFAPAMAAPHYCLSSEVAAPLVEAGAASVQVAAKPEESSLFDLFDAPNR